MTKKKLVLVIILILIVALFIAWYKQPKTPLTALEKEYIGKEESILRYSDLIGQIDINSKESLLFYYNGKGNVNCAVADKKFGGGYNIINVSAELAPYRDDLRAGLFGSTYRYGDNFKWIYFGIIYDDSVERIVWNSVEANMFSTTNMEMFYAIGSGSFGDKGNGEYFLYDSIGNELEHQKFVQ